MTDTNIHQEQEQDQEAFGLKLARALADTIIPDQEDELNEDDEPPL